MAARNVSPGGALLRASRVFAIPPPLPAPTSSLFGSDTATLPHPIHQSITTPFQALQKGDWGFKRPLPKKSTTNTSTPSIRVKAIDNYHQYTDFVSSADHALTLKKWQEMEMPLTIPVVKKHDNTPRAFKTGERRSVFDEEVDKIADIEEKLGSEDLRWKFKGPWLAALSEGDFQEYLRKSVKGRKTEFQEFLRGPCAELLTANARRAFISSDEDTAAHPKTYNASDVTEEQLKEFNKSLRNDRSSLNRLIRAFLDLPPAPTKNHNTETGKTLSFLDTLSPGQKEEDDMGLPPSDSPYANSGPPKTHPSAGLSYLRTSAFTPNHPVYGPRRSKTPVEARIVVPKGSGLSRRSAQPLIGVGGVVCDIPTGSNNGGWDTTGKGNTVAGLLSIEPDKVGGSKAYVTPNHATVDPQGRVIMKVDAADPAEVAIKLGKTPEIKRDGPQTGRIGSSRSIWGSQSMSGRDYGLGSSSTPISPFSQPRPKSEVLDNAAFRDELDDLGI